MTNIYKLWIFTFSKKDDIMKTPIKNESEVKKIMKTVAVIGCGRIANLAHLPALSALEEVRIKYACDLLIEKQRL